jgi:flavocytochrome c
MKHTYQQETDVVVIGGGLAGYRAALEAANGGANVLLLEKRHEIGGSTVLSGGFLAFADTDMQRKAGIEDSNARMLQDLKNAGAGKNDERLLAVYIEHQLETYEWLKSIGVAFKAVQLSSGQSVPRTHPVDPYEMIGKIKELGEATGRVRTIFNAPAERLIRSEEGGPVEGVRVLIDGKSVSIRALRGVVLAAGGFSRNEEMLENCVPHQAKAVRYGGYGNVGDAIRMACDLGAGVRDMAYVKGTFGFHPNSATQEGRDWTKLPVYRGGIAVNKAGQRYVDESKSYKLLGDAVMQQPGAVAYQIFDQTIMNNAGSGVPPFDFEAAEGRGLLFKSDSLAGLAKQIGVDATALENTLKRYNAGVDQGKDEDFGRDGLSTHYGKRVKLERAPFYAYPSTSGVIATYCGLTVDPDTRVIDLYGKPIDRLFAAGELMGGFHGVSYMTGSSLGKCLIFGSIAGRNAARV